MTKIISVPIEKYIEQVQDGLEYKGYIKIASIKLDYELKFAIPIPKLDEMEQPKGFGEARRLFQISMSKEGINIDLSNEEYLFFFDLTAPFAIAFCATKFMVRNGSEFVNPAKAIWDTDSVGIITNGMLELTPSVSSMLHQLKFRYSVTV